MKKVALGIDIGGTGTKYGFVDKEGKIYCESSIPTPKAEQKEGTITEDELKQAENEIQKMTDKKIDEIDKILEGKEKEIMSV